jgi:hypothetical protein
MSEQTVEQLFDEFAQAYQRGESPDVPAYLARAGRERDELGDLIDRFLQAVPAQPATEEEIILMQAHLEREPPLLVLRRRRKLPRAAVVDAIVKSLGLDLRKRDKVAGYYHELEVGTLDPKPVSGKVWDALGEFLHANVRALAGLRPPPIAVAEAFRREADLASWAPMPDARVAEPKRRRYRASHRPGVDRPRAEPEQDEIDRLFTGAS